MKPSSQPLRPSPFLSRRDPITGKWLIIKPNSELTNKKDPHADGDDAFPNASGF